MKPAKDAATPLLFVRLHFCLDIPRVSSSCLPHSMDKVLASLIALRVSPLVLALHTYDKAESRTAAHSSWMTLILSCLYLSTREGCSTARQAELLLVHKQLTNLVAACLFAVDSRCIRLELPFGFVRAEPSPRRNASWSVCVCVLSFRSH